MPYSSFNIQLIFLLSNFSIFSFFCLREIDLVMVISHRAGLMHEFLVFYHVRT